MVGRPGRTLWVTHEIHPDERQRGKATELRDALGLIECGAGQDAFLVKLGESMDSIGLVCAPTAFDALGYSRFRSWPPPGGKKDSDAGRTYDLDAARRTAGVDHGRREMVLAPRPLAMCEDIIGIGAVGTNPDTSVESHMVFADEVCPGKSVRRLIAELRAI
jgi:hypothetical protein